ncbi:TPA: hypothetical protein N2A70_006647, partial [Pseudomonas aeruginosa]|nr:hypothetical protein [Pseudomonas aeruginosa]
DEVVVLASVVDDLFLPSAFVDDQLSRRLDLLAGERELQHIAFLHLAGTSSHRSVMVKRPSGSPVSEADLAELQRDAARYRWVKQRAWYVDRAAEVYELDRVRGSAFREAVPVDDDDVESAIDAAMQSAAHDEIEEGRDG